MNRPIVYYRIGAGGPDQTPEDVDITERVAAGVKSGLKQITLTLVLVAVATGASLAIGNWIAHRYILPKR